MPVSINGVDKQGVSINAVQVKQALDPTNETVNKGVYDPTTLSAVDADLQAANIKLAVNIFGKVGTLAAGITYTDYHYYEDLAGVASYTPPAQSQSLLCNETTLLGTNEVRVEFHDGVGWNIGHQTTPIESTCHVFQDTDQNLRVYNNSGALAKISLTGVTWTAGFTNYHYYEDLVAGATYLPPAKSIASLFAEYGSLSSENSICVEFYDGAAWLDAHRVTPTLESSRMLFQDNDQNIRIKNSNATLGRKFSLTGVTW